jgi:hypothetical protein
MPKHSRSHNIAAALAHGILAGITLIEHGLLMALPELLLAGMHAREALKK